jgi:hypothetical protein
LGTGPVDAISLARSASAKAELLNKRPSNKTVEIANLLTGGASCIVSSSLFPASIFVGGSRRHCLPSILELCCHARTLVETHAGQA